MCVDLFFPLIRFMLMCVMFLANHSQSLSVFSRGLLILQLKLFTGMFDKLSLICVPW